MRFTWGRVFKILAFIFSIALYFVVSINDLYIDVINPDGINWHNRTQTFSEALKSGKYSDTYQIYHPGITLMWISGPLLNVFRNNVYEGADPKAVFLDKDYYAKLSLVIFSTIIFILTFIVLWKLVKFSYGFYYSIILTLEPFVLGMRRLYHLDYLMTILVFLSFLLVIYFSYKKSHWLLLPIASIFYALALLTKSTAILFLIFVPVIILFGKIAVYKKVLAICLLLTSLVIFIYAFFPALWENPIKTFPKYFERISLGASNIGVEGKKEIGSSGKETNITLDNTIRTKDTNFYFLTLFMRFSAAGSILVLCSVGIYLYIFLRGFFSLMSNVIRKNQTPVKFDLSTDSWISFWSLGVSIAVLLAFTIAAKKLDRYVIFVFPFLIAVVSQTFGRLNKWISILLLVAYVCFTSYELYKVHPYYVAYSNPLLGGIETRLYALDDSPFGIGTYESFNIVKSDMLNNNYDGYYTIAGSKSIKAIAEGGKFSRGPSCLTDYVIEYSLEFQPTEYCLPKYNHIGTVKVSGFDYWYVYKRQDQKHESNHE